MQFKTHCVARGTVAVAVVGLALIGTTPLEAQRAATKQTTVRPHNSFVTVDEFVRSRRPAGTPVRVEGYFVTVLKTSGNSATCGLVDTTDKVLSASDAAATARAGAACTVPLGGKGKGRWVMTRKGLLSLAMYSGSSKPTTFVQDTPPKVRVTGITGKGRATIVNVSRIEYQDENGEWKNF